MPLSRNEAFKVGFLARCADEGLSDSAIASRVAAGHALMNKTGGIADSLKGLAQTAFLTAPMIGLAGSAGIGAGGGLLAAKLTERDVDADEFKKRELISQYAEFARRARMAAARRNSQQHKPSTAGMAFA